MNSVNLYPLTSVEAGMCSQTTSFPMDQGFATNLGMRSVSFKKPLEPEITDCYERINISSNTVKKTVDKITPLNQQVYTDKRAPNYRVTTRNGCNPIYYNEDPRLIEPIRYHQSFVDTPPINSRIRMKDIYTEPSLENYRVLQGKPYEEIGDGQILYYKSQATSGPFLSPVFQPGLQYNQVLFQDPMGAIRPQYEMTEPSYESSVTSIRSNPCSLFIEDTQAFREGLMSLQMGKMNSQKWSARWMDEN